jgi:hypothetical protein
VIECSLLAFFTVHGKSFLSKGINNLTGCSSKLASRERRTRVESRFTGRNCLLSYCLLSVPNIKFFCDQYTKQKRWGACLLKYSIFYLCQCQFSPTPPLPILTPASNCEKFTVSTLTIYHVSVFVHSSLATGLCHGTVHFAKYRSTGRSVSRQTVEIATQQGPQQKSTHPTTTTLGHLFAQMLNIHRWWKLMQILFIQTSVLLRSPKGLRYMRQPANNTASRFSHSRLFASLSTLSVANYRLGQAHSL